LVESMDVKFVGTKSQLYMVMAFGCNTYFLLLKNKWIALHTLALSH
jgi:hypothetical protein